MDKFSPAEVLTNPQSEALIEELKHWVVVIDPKGNAQVTTKDK